MQGSIRFNNYENPLQIQRLSTKAIIPTRATPESIGYDIYATNQIIIPRSQNALINTGLAMRPPKGCYVRIASRSGLALKKSIQVGAGVVDPDYTGEIKVVLFNQGKEDFEVKIGDKIAQIIMEQAKTPPIQILPYLKPTLRQDKGFGSTSLVETQEAPATTNICEANTKTTRHQKIDRYSDNLIVLPKIMERPPGCSFIGSKPTTILVALGHIDGPSTEVIIDSGSDITLISPKAISLMSEPPKHHQGKKVTLSQVTAKIAIDGYVDLPLYFSTDQGPIQANVEAYVVKGMTTPLILGNDFADQYSLSIERKDGESTLHFSDTGRSLKLSNSTSDSHIPSEVRTFLAAIKAKKHKIANHMRNKAKKQKPFFKVAKNVVIPPFTSKFIKIVVPWLGNLKEVFLETHDKKDKRLAPLQILDSIIAKGRNTIMVINPTDCPIHLVQGDELGTVLDLSVLDEQVDPMISQEVVKFSTHTKAILQTFKRSPGNEHEELEHAEKQPEQPPGPKTAEVPEFDFIPREQLISALDINPKLDPQQRKQVEKILIKNHQAFSLDGRIGKYTDIQYEIKLDPQAKPISLAPYHASPEKRDVIDKQLEKWYSQDVIEQADSPWGAPVIVVYRFNKPRVCIDYRGVNSVSAADEYPLPRQTDILRALTGSQWLSTFDALSGFQQIEIKKDHRPITAFRCHQGLLQFKRLPFGLKNGPSVFQRIMNKVLAPMLWLFVLVYIDDIVAYSRTFEDHLTHLDKVLGAIINANITLSPPKCHIGYQSLILLGQKVSRLGVSTHKEKVDAIQAVKPPTKISELQAFLGMVNYFANYIPFYAWITKPLYSLLRKDSTWNWSEVHQRAFELCKEALTMSPVLGFPISGLGYRLYTDASDYGIGAVLQQVQPIKIKDLKGTKAYNKLKDAFDNKMPIPSLVTQIKEEKSQIPESLTWANEFEDTQVWVERVIAYWSRLFKQAEKNYSSTEKEALALKEALVKFQAILEGENIMAITDHSALTWSKTYQSVNKRLLKWGLTYAAYPGLKIVHRAGRVHSNVDPISRLHRRIPFYDSPSYLNDPQVELDPGQEIDFYEKYRHKVESMAYKVFTNDYLNVMTTSIQLEDKSITYNTSTKMETHLHIDPKQVELLVEEYQQDPHFSEVLESSGKVDSRFKQYSVRQDGVILFNNWSGYSRICLPRSIVPDILKEVHNNITGTAHAGYEKTYKRIAQAFYWPRMSQDIKKFVYSCIICKQIKHPRHAPYGVLQPIPIPDKPFEVVTMDLITDLPESQNHNAIFVIVCKLTKYAFFIPCTTKMSEKQTAKLFFDNLVCHVGLPKQIISDRDTRWRNDFWKEVCEYMGSKRALTTAYHPQADGQTEILNQTIEVALRAFVNFDRNNWSQLLSRIAFAYNNTPHTATGYSPALLLYGFKPNEPLSYLLEPDSSNISRPKWEDLIKDDSKEFIEEFEGIRQVAKDALRKAQVTFEKAYNKNHIPLSFEVGDLAMINLHSLHLPDVTEGKGVKLTRRFEGPFEIIDKLSDVTYRLRIPHTYDIHPVISIAHLERHIPSPEEFGERDHLSPLREETKSTQEYEILEIVNERKIKKRGKYIMEYQCNWKGYGVTQEWIPLRNLKNAQDLLEEWKSKKKKLKGGKST